MARIGITETAARLGVSVDSIRRRIRKGELAAERDNRGQWWIELADNAAPAVPMQSVDDRIGSASIAPAQLPMQMPMQPPPSDPRDATIEALKGEVSTLREALARERDRVDVVRLEGQEARERTDRVMAGRDQVLQEREDARVRAAAAEGELKAVREALAEAQRPAWRRLLGWQ